MATATLKAWSFDRVVRRFRDAAGKLIDRVKFSLSQKKYVEAEIGHNKDITERLFANKIDISQWLSEVKDNLKRQYVSHYVLGGGTSLSFEDYQIISAQLKKQYKFLNAFAKDIASGRYTEEQAAAVLARLNLYTNGAEQVYHRGLAEAWGIELPAYPRDGSTPCLGNCTCSWVLVDKGDTIEATWKLGVTEQHCTECPDRAKKWVGLKFKKGKTNE